MEGAYPVPHGERGIHQEVLKSLLSQKQGILRMGLRSKQYLEKSAPSAPIMEPLAPLHLKSEATH